jgi:hypothetical protein
MRVIKKVLAFPVIVLLTVLNWILHLIIKAESLVSAVGLIVIGICIVLAIVNKMWLQLGIFGLVLVLGVVIVLLSAEFVVQVERTRNRLKSL